MSKQKSIANSAATTTSKHSEMAWNPSEICETEHFDLRKFIWILRNWNKLGSSVGKAYINGEVVDNEAFYTVVKTMISDCVSTKDKFPIGDYKTSYKQGSLGFGRFIATKTSLINIARPVRHTICQGLYQDIDFVNCHLYIYKYLCAIYSVQCEIINEYISKREECLSDLCTVNPGLSRDNAKQAFLSVLNGGLCTSIQTFTPFFQRYYDDFHSRIHREIVVHIDQEHPEIRPHVVEKYGASTFNLNCKIISKVLEDYENRMRHYLCEFVRSKNFDFSSHCYDGGMSYLPLNSTPILTRLNLEEASIYISQHTGIYNPLKFKMFDECIDIPQEELRHIVFDDFVYIKNEHAQDYASVKYRFEKEHFFCKESTSYYFINGNTHLEYTREDFAKRYENLYYEEYNLAEKRVIEEAFIYRWFKDRKKRFVERVVFVPKGGVVQEGEFNLWKGFFVDHVVPDGKDHSEQINVFLRHIEFLSNQDMTVSGYLLKWIARMFQQPYRKSEVLVGIKSLVEGVKKTFLYDLFTAMMGRELTSKIENPERDLFGDFNELIMNKIFILLEEWDSGVNMKYAKRLLDAITCSVDNINLKGRKKFVNPSYSNYMCVWNKNGLRFGEHDRRVFATEVNVKKAPPSDYFNTLYRTLADPQALRAFYDYLCQIDLTSYHPSRDRPSTTLREEILTITRDRIELWVQSYIIDKLDYIQKGEFPPGKTKEYYINEGFKPSTEQMYDDFMSYLKRFGYRDYSCNFLNFSKRLKQLSIEGFNQYGLSGKSKYHIYVDKAIKSMIALKWISEEELKEYENESN